MIMKQLQPRFVLVCASLRELLFFSSSHGKVSSGMRSLSCASEPTKEEEPKREEDEEENAEEDQRGEAELEEKGESGRDVGAITMLQRSVKQLHFGGWEEKEAAAAEIKRMARKDALTRKSLAALGVIPSLVSMLDSDDDRHRTLAIQALIELANGSFTNKALMAEAGVLKRLPSLIMDATDPSGRKECLVLLFSVSSLAKSRFNVSASDVLPLLIEILDDSSAADELKLICLGTLYNLSTKVGNARAIISDGAVRTLLRLSSGKAASEIALAVLGNLVVTAMGKTAIEEDEMAPEALFEIIRWQDKPRSQELAVYILMVLAQRSSLQRRKMAESGLVPLLLEVALLGTPLAQKRALKTLQLFKTDRHPKMAGHSGPQARRSALSMDTVADQRETKEHRGDVKKMVKQSLHKNMEYILRRACFPIDDSMPKSLVVRSSTKSQPY